MREDIGCDWHDVARNDPVAKVAHPARSAGVLASQLGRTEHSLDGRPVSEPHDHEYVPAGSNSPFCCHDGAD